MASPEIKLMSVSNVYVRQMTFLNTGDVELGHTHPFDHTTLVSAGKVRVTVNDVATEYAAPTMIFIKAEEFHTLEALEDNTVVSCIHALRDGDGVDDIIDPASIPAGVTLRPNRGDVKKLVERRNPKARKQDRKARGVEAGPTKIRTARQLLKKERADWLERKNQQLRKPQTPDTPV